MKDTNRPFVIGAMCVTVLILILGNVSCQYDYYSPQPGVLELHLKTVSNDIPFAPLNNFVLKVDKVAAIRSDNSQVIIYEDANAIGRSPNTYNTLDLQARDSSLVVGQGYIPPGDYSGVGITLLPGSQVTLDGYRFIDVVKSADYNSVLSFRQPFKIEENGIRQITLAINLDSSLVKGYRVYYFRPYYYISSIQ